MKSQRRFPPLWSVEEGETYFVVKDHDGQQLAYVYFDDGPAPREAALNLGLLARPRARSAAGRPIADPSRA